MNEYGLSLDKLVLAIPILILFAWVVLKILETINQLPH